MAVRDPANPDEITRITIAHYDRSADAFWEGTRDHDVTQNISALLQHLPGKAPFTVLDFGCGPGRDLKAFADLGHAAIGLDGSERFVAMAHRFSGCEVWHQNFLELELPNQFFDGIFANASLFHVPGWALPRVLQELRASLKPAGILFSSNPLGQNQEGWSDDRYGAFHDLGGWRSYLESAGFSEVDHYYRPAGVPREQQRWLASLWRRSSEELPAAGR